MPYIKEQDKVQVVANLDRLIENIKEFPLEEREGVVNYVISTVVASSLKPDTGWRYKWLNRAMGVLTCATQEFYRRLVAPYEDNCIKKNGDILEYMKD